MAPFNEQSVYNKHQQGCDCEDKSTCGCEKTDCGCCPPGLVAVYNSDGDHAACLTPNDAALYASESHIPPTGYQKVFNTQGQYIGDMTNADAIAYYQAFGTIDPPVTAGEFNPTTISAASLAAAPQAGTSTVPVVFIVDRLTCEDAITVQFSGAKPAGLTFIGGASTLSIPTDQSFVLDGIQIDDTVAIGVYAVTIAYTGCGNTETQVLTVTVV